jgi:hypothetical protein
LKLLSVDRRRGRILGRGGCGVGHGVLAERPGVQEVSEAVSRFMYQCLVPVSGFRSVIGQFPQPAVPAPQPPVRVDHTARLRSTIYHGLEFKSKSTPRAIHRL